MVEELIQKVDETLDLYVQYLSPESCTRQAIVNEEPWGAIAGCARGEGYHDLADFLYEAENMEWE